ncbi:DUF1223 domain-containing protein [Brevundimonas sp.]
MTIGLTLMAATATAQNTGTRVNRQQVAETGAPVVVELFTAQGCGVCADANARLEAVANEPGVIALTYAVDYWDYMGWQDTFARPEFALRQRAYRRPLQIRDVSTPQLVINGHRQVASAPTPALQTAIDQETARRAAPPEIEFRETGDRVGIGSGRAPVGGAEVVAVRYRPGVQTVDVSAGENRGRQLRHTNVVLGIQTLGDWSGRPVLYALPDEMTSGEAVAVLVQAKVNRRILVGAVLAPR